MRRRSGASARGCSIRIRLAGAEHAFNRSTEIDPADRAGWIGLARVYLQRDETRRAAGLLERLASSGPADGYTLQLLGTAYRASDGTTGPRRPCRLARRESRNGATPGPTRCWSSAGVTPRC